MHALCLESQWRLASLGSCLGFAVMLLLLCVCVCVCVCVCEFGPGRGGGGGGGSDLARLVRLCLSTFY